MTALKRDEMPREKLLAFRSSIVTALGAQHDYEAFVINVLPGIANVSPDGYARLTAVNRTYVKEARVTTRALEKILKTVDRKASGRRSLLDFNADPVKAAGEIMNKVEQEYEYLETLARADARFGNVKQAIAERIARELPNEEKLNRSDWIRRKAAQRTIARDEITKFHNANPGLYSTAEAAETNYLVLSSVTRGVTTLVKRHKEFVDRFAKEARELSKEGGYTALVKQENLQEENTRSAAIA